jgi:hypothetical protein
VLKILLALEYKPNFQRLVEGHVEGKAWRKMKGSRRGDAEQDRGNPE